MFALLPPLLLVQLTALSPVRATCSLSSHPQPQQKRPHCLLVQCSETTLALGHVQESHLHSMDGGCVVQQ